MVLGAQRRWLLTNRNIDSTRDSNGQGSSVSHSCVKDVFPAVLSSYIINYEVYLQAVEEAALATIQLHNSSGAICSDSLLSQSWNPGVSIILTFLNKGNN